MKVFVTGVAGQLGHDVMNELAGRGYEGIGSDIKEEYSGIKDGTPVESMLMCLWISQTRHLWRKSSRK